MLRRVDTTKLIKPIIGGCGKYSINIHGLIKNESMDNVKTYVDETGNEFINIQFLGIVKNWRIVDLVACHFKFLEDILEYSELEQVIGFYLDDTLSNKNSAFNIGYRFKNGKLPCKWNNNFYFVPGYPTRALDINGNMISTVDGEVRTWGIQQPIPKRNIKGGYRNNNAYMRGTRYVISRHRSLLLIFKPYPDNVDKLVSNHINGIPGDDHLDNLEWVTRSGNNNHAYSTGLRKQNKPVLLRNVNTGQIDEYYSVAECGRRIGISDKILNHRLEKGKFCSVDSNGYQIKYVSDSRDWLNPNDVVN